MIEFTQGDIFSNNADIRVNTVNCVGAMGKGVALAFKKKYPSMFKQYKQDCDNGLVRIGKMHIWKDLTTWIINFPTKDNWKNPSTYEYIESGLKALSAYLAEQGNVTVALPALGCGNGGLDWSIVSDMIVAHLANLDAKILVYTPGDSHSAGQSIETVSTLQNNKLMTDLGFVKNLSSSSNLWAKGNQCLLDIPWMFFFRPSNDKNKQLASVIAISKELSSNSISPVFIYHNEHDLHILQILDQHEIPSIVALPFFVPSRRSLLLKLDKLQHNLYISLIDKEIQHIISHNKTQNFILHRAAGLIFSDISLESFSNDKSIISNSTVSKYFVYYNELSNNDLLLLQKYNFREIKKNLKTNRPNICEILRNISLKKMKCTHQAIKDEYTLKFTPADLRLLAEVLEKNHTDSIDIRIVDHIIASDFIDLKNQI